MPSVSRKKAAVASKGRTKAKVANKKKATVAKKAGAVAKKIGATAKKKKISRVPPNLEIDPEVLDFIEAIDKYKKKHNRPFPSWSEVLYVFRKLGYKRS
jgi:hypothetical protein